MEISVYGPPPTSGTRDAFAELALEGGCKAYSWIKALEKEDKNRFKNICHSVREDGAYIETGENDNLIVQKLTNVERYTLPLWLSPPGIQSNGVGGANRGKLKFIPVGDTV